MARWRGTTTQRGYGHTHQALRAQLLAQFTPGQPCARCGRPILDKAQTDLGHIDGTSKQQYAGLEHRRCNRVAGARLKNRKRRPPVTMPAITVVTTPSRDW